MIKVALNSAMPLLDDATLRALAAAAHAHRLPVVVHAEGPDQPARALAAGADTLAHTPWTERLDDNLVRDLAAGLTIISTLAIFAGEEAEVVALDNLARFHRARGRIRYGTDMGNGPTPVGVNHRELTALVAAGLDVSAILEAVCRADDDRPADLDPARPARAGRGPARLAADGAPQTGRARRRTMTNEPSAADLDRHDPLGRFRHHFAGAEDGVLAYLDGNSLGRPVRAVPERLGAFVRGPWGQRLIRSWDEAWMAEPFVVGDRLGEVALGAAAGQVFVGDSTSVLIYKLVRAAVDAAVAADPARTEMIIDRDNFVTDRFLLQGIAAERGLTIRWLEVDRTTGVTAADLEPVLGPQTAIVVVSHVAFWSGFLADAATMTAQVHDVGALMFLDLSHSVGSVPVELDAWGVDLAAGCTYKYLNGGPGSPAFGFVRHGLQDRLEQPIWGWMGADDVFTMGPDYRPAPGIRRFLSGTPPILAMQPMQAMVDLIAEAGLPAIRTKSLALTDRTIGFVDDQLAPLGVRLSSPRDPDRRGSHVTITHPLFREILPRLWERGVIPDFRNPDALRIGLSPLTTTYAELDLGLASIRDELTDERTAGAGAVRTSSPTPTGS